MLRVMKRWLQDLSLSAAVAGFVAVLVGFTSSVAIVFQAAQALGATPAQTSSWSPARRPASSCRQPRSARRSSWPARKIRSISARPPSS